MPDFITSDLASWLAVSVAILAGAASVMIWLRRPRSGIIPQELSVQRDAESGLVEAKQLIDFVPLYGMFYVKSASYVVIGGRRRVPLEPQADHVGVIHHGGKPLGMHFVEPAPSRIPNDWIDFKVEVDIRLQDGAHYKRRHAVRMGTIMHAELPKEFAEARRQQSWDRKLKEDDKDNR